DARLALQNVHEYEHALACWQPPLETRAESPERSVDYPNLAPRHVALAVTNDAIGSLSASEVFGRDVVDDPWTATESGEAVHASCPLDVIELPRKARADEGVEWKHHSDRRADNRSRPDLDLREIRGNATLPELHTRELFSMLLGTNHVPATLLTEIVCRFPFASGYGFAARTQARPVRVP